MTQDIRWIQRLDNFQRAMQQLDQAIALTKERDLSTLELQGLIQSFEYNYELAWNLIKDFYVYQGGEVDIQGSRDAFRTAFARGLIEDGDIWMNMIKSRQQTVHTYNQQSAETIADAIVHQYHPALSALCKTMLTKVTSYA